MNISRRRPAGPRRSGGQGRKGTLLRRGDGEADRAGFTLVEVLVVLIILSLLTAGVLPVVLQQIGRADPVRISSDLRNLKTGMQNFGLDARPEFPGDLEDLVYRPASSVELSVDGSEYGTTAAAWDGPYIDSGLVEDLTARATGDAISTGFSSEIQNDIVCFNRATNVASGATCAKGTHTVVIKINGLTPDQFILVDELIDGTPGDSTAGNFRKVSGVSYYFASPYN